MTSINIAGYIISNANVLHRYTSILQLIKYKQRSQKRKTSNNRAIYRLTRLGSRFLGKTRCRKDRRGFLIPNKREIRLRREYDRLSDRDGSWEETRPVGIGFRSVHCALKNLHKYIPWPLYRGLAARRRNKWGRHVSGYSLFAGKHLPGL